MNTEKITNEEVLNEEEVYTIDLLKRTPSPVLEYGVPQYFCITRTEGHRKEILVKGANEHQPDTKKIKTWYKITGHLIDLDYGTIGIDFDFNAFENDFNLINKIVLNQNTFILCFVFSPYEYEYEKKDKDGNPTGEMATAIKPKIDKVERLTPQEIRRIRELQNAKTK